MQTTGDNRYDAGLSAIANRMSRTGLTGDGQRLWDDGELRVLKATWPDAKGLACALPDRSFGAVRQKALELGLRGRKRSHSWTNMQVKRLEAMWPLATPDELLTAFPWATWHDLKNKAQDLRRQFPNLTRPKPKPAPTGHAVVDSLIDRAWSANVSLVQLDGLARTGRYFGAGRYRRYVAWEYVGRAVKALGGELDADWDQAAPRSPR